jgi:hypothetical protein
MSSPQLRPNKITDDEVKNKSSIELRLTEPMLIANKKMRIYSSAGIGENPHVVRRCSSSVSTKLLLIRFDIFYVLQSKIKVNGVKIDPLVDAENVPPEAQFHLKIVGYSHYF